MVLFSMGNINFDKIVKWADNLIGEIPDYKAETNRQAPQIVEASQSVIEKDTHQAHVIMGQRAFSLHDKQRISLFLLNNMLGGPGMNSRLNIALRERHGLVYNVESNITSYTDTGIASIYFGTDPKNREKATRLVCRELESLCEKRLAEKSIAAAKKQLIGQIGVSNDNKESLFLGLGKSFLHYNRYDSQEEVVRQIEAISPEDIFNVANQVFAPDKLFRLVYL